MPKYSAVRHSQQCRRQSAVWRTRTSQLLCQTSDQLSDKCHVISAAPRVVQVEQNRGARSSERIRRATQCMHSRAGSRGPLGDQDNVRPRAHVPHLISELLAALHYGRRNRSVRRSQKHEYTLFSL